MAIFIDSDLLYIHVVVPFKTTLTVVTKTRNIFN